MLSAFWVAVQIADSCKLRLQMSFFQPQNWFQTLVLAVPMVIFCFDGKLARTVNGKRSTLNVAGISGYKYRGLHSQAVKNANTDNAMPSWE